MSKLLSDEEIREKLACIMGGCIGSHSDCYYERIGEDAPVDSLEEMQQMITMQIDLINTQKRLYAERVRGAIADYMYSEGCYCCEGGDHDQHKEALAKLLDVPKHKDGSGYDFLSFMQSRERG